MRFLSCRLLVRGLLLSLVSGLGLAGGLGAVEVTSPNGAVWVDVQIVDGRPTYDVRLNGEVVLERSILGLTRGDVDYSRSIRLAEVSHLTRVEERYTLATGKRREHRYRATRRVFHLAGAKGERLDVVFQVSNDGVAFRYVFPETDAEVREVREEATGFRLPADARAWLQPMSVAKTGWAKTNPSYEEYHERDIAVGTPSPLGAGWVFPALFRVRDTWVLISEADVARGYCASRLAHDSAGGDYRIGFPDARETIGAEPVGPAFATPYATPWRVIALGDLRRVAESTLGTDLAPAPARGMPPVGAPGHVAWSWPKLGDGKTVYDVQKRFVDFAAEMGWAYCLTDALWDTQIGEERTRELAAYATSRGVGLLLWYNSNGDWNEAFQTPKNRLLTRETRRAEFARLREWGVRGVKVDFFGGDGRAFVALYQDILADAAEAGLLVNFHGATLPRGWQRTYPNLMTAEAVRGFEFITFEQVNADRAPAHIAMLPFTRNVFDPMDFTPLSLARLPKIQLRTTPVAELATAVLFTSGLQHYVETPEGMAKQPDWVREAVRGIPVSWEETRFLAGYPGEHVALARRGADGRWWVAGFNAGPQARMMEVPLRPLGRVGSGQGEWIVDATAGRAGEGAYARVTLSPEGRDRIVRFEVPAGGGFFGVLR